MKANQLIKELQALIDKHGDLDCKLVLYDRDQLTHIRDGIRHGKDTVCEDNPDSHDYFVLFEGGGC